MPPAGVTCTNGLLTLLQLHGRFETGRTRRKTSAEALLAGRCALPLQSLPLCCEGPKGARRSLAPPAQATVSGFEFSPRQSTAVKVLEHGQQAGKRIVAETVVRAPVDTVWRVLTDYEALPGFVPNLERCERLPSTKPGRVLLQQTACSQGVLWRLQAEAVLEVEEIVGPLGRREARFAAVSGDFHHLVGRWVVEPDPSSAASSATVLRYDISIQPRLSLPAPIVSYVVRAGLPANIKAIVQKSEELANSRLKVSGLASWAGVEEDPPLLPVINDAASALSSTDGREMASSGSATLDQQGTGIVLPAKGPFWPSGSPYAASAPLTALKQQREAAAEAARRAYLGTASVPLPPSGSAEASIQQVLNQRQEEKERLQASYPAFGLRQSKVRIQETDTIRTNGSSANGTSVKLKNTFSVSPVAPSSLSLPTEVHLRRLDGLDYLHRRAVAAISIDAAASAVWEVLTDYDQLADFVPNLAASQRIALPSGAPSHMVRVRQVGYKNMLYMCLHAESVLDLIEKPHMEIQFRQVAGDFKRFQGKWMLTEGPADADFSAPGYAGPQTQLKYAVEVVIPRSLKLLGVIEPLLERVVFEDVPANLAAIKRRVEAVQAERMVEELEQRGEVDRAATLRRRKSRPRLSDMAEDFAVLAAELQRCFGVDATVPTRSALRDAGRSDLEKAIAAHGGPAVVAERLGWRLQARARKPRGYWDSLPNVKLEVDEFIDENRLEPGVMPLKNDFVRAGRFDLARAVERWGGLYELAAELGYATASPSFSGTEWQEHISEVAAETGLSGKQGLFKLAAKTYKQRSSGSYDSDDTGTPNRSDSDEFLASGNGRQTANGRRRRKQESTRMISVRQEIDAW